MADLGDFGVGWGRRRSPGDGAGFMSRARCLLSSSYFIHVSTPHFVMWLYDCCRHFSFLEFFRLNYAVCACFKFWAYISRSVWKNSEKGERRVVVKPPGRACSEGWSHLLGSCATAHSDTWATLKSFDFLSTYYHYAIDRTHNYRPVSSNMIKMSIFNSKFFKKTAIFVFCFIWSQKWRHKWWSVQLQR